MRDEETTTPDAIKGGLDPANYTKEELIEELKAGRQIPVQQFVRKVMGEGKEGQELNEFDDDTGLMEIESYVIAELGLSDGTTLFTSNDEWMWYEE